MQSSHLSVKHPTAERATDNYRPISNLSYLSKLIKCVANSELRSHIDRYSVLSPLQSAYRPFFSPERAVLKVYSDITDAADNGQIKLLALFDLNAAFNTVDHVTLLDCLHVSGGVNGTVLSWFSSYLRSRSALVSWNGITSDPIFLEHGVPQGFVLGALLFLIYTIGIDKIFIRHNFNVHMYADDIQAYAHCIPSEQSNVVL